MCFVPVLVTLTIAVCCCAHVGQHLVLLQGILTTRWNTAFTQPYNVKSLMAIFIMWSGVPVLLNLHKRSVIIFSIIINMAI